MFRNGKVFLKRKERKTKVMKIISSNKISKKVFVLLMSLVMCVTMIPQTTFAGATEEQKEKVYGNDITWTDWTSTTTLPSPTTNYANYQLTDDVTLDSTWNVPYTGNWAGKIVRLNLNGKTISMASNVQATVIRVNETTFELYDTAGGGTITGGVGNTGKTNDCGGGVAVGHSPSSEGPKADTFIMYGGTITNNSAPFAGGGVIVFDHPEGKEQSTFKMEGGAITNNHTMTGTGHGAGVQCQGTFVMDGGTISGNEAVNHAGGLYITATGNGTINGGEISDNNAGTTGAGIEARGATTIKACTISGNGAKGNGGGINVGDNGNLTINASDSNRVLIKRNNASGGGGLSVSGSAEATIINTDITDNDALGSGDGGGVLVESTAKAHIKDGTAITENREAAAGEDLNLGGAGITSTGLLELDGTSSPVTITENHDLASQLGGVYQSNKSAESGLSIKGAVVIDSNVNDENKPANLIYDIKNGNGDGKSVNITGPLATTKGKSQIGFTLTQGDPVDGKITESTGKLTTNYIAQNPEAQLKDFFSLNTLESDWNMVWGSGTAPGEGETEIWVAEHVHAWEYLADGNIIYAYCTAEPGCDHHGDHEHLDKAAKLTLTTPNADYTGNPYAGTSIVDEIEEATGETHSPVTYKGAGSTIYPESATPPTLPGTYTAMVSVEDKTATSNFKISALKPTIVTPPKALENLKYKGTAQDLVEQGEVQHGTIMYRIGTTGEYTSDLPSKVNAGSYDVYWYVKGDEGYEDYTPENPKLTVDIAKEDLIIKPDPNQTKVYGENDPALTYTSEGLATGDSISGKLKRTVGENAGEYAFDISDLKAGEAGTDNYNISLQANAPKFEILKKSLMSTDIKITVTKDKYTYDGTIKTPVVGVTDKGVALDASSFAVGGQVSGTIPAEYKLSVIGLENYTDSVDVKWEIVKGQANLIKAPTKVPDLEYDKTEQKLVNSGTASNGTVVYGTKIGGAFTETIPTGKDAGSYTIYYYVKGNEHYNDAGSPNNPLGSVKVSIERANIIIKPSAGQSKVYGEKDPELTYTSEGKFYGDKITGSLGREVGENVGEYSYNLGTITAGTNYNIALDTNAPKFKITPKSLNHKDIIGKLSETSFVYNKGGQGPDSLSIKDGGKELRSFDFIIQEDSQWDGVNVGTYKIFVLGTNNYKDTKVLEWKITPKSLSDKDIELILEPDNFVYTGDDQGPDTITVKDGDDVLQGSDYIIDPLSVLKAKETGDYVITVKGEGNYSGSKSAVWHIEGADIEATAKGVDVEYDGHPHHITVDVDKPAEGYKITYSTDGKEYSETNPEFVNAGNYVVYFKITAHGFNELKGSVKIDIHSKVLTDDMLEITPDKIKHSGEEQGPTIIVRDGDKELIEGVDYIIDQSSRTRATDVGTYKVKVVGIGNYQGSILGQWEITGGKKPVPVPPKPKPVPAPVNHKTAKKATKAIATGDSNLGILFAGLGLVAGISALAIRRKTKQK